MDIEMIYLFGALYLLVVLWFLTADDIQAWLRRRFGGADPAVSGVFSEVHMDLKSPLAEGKLAMHRILKHEGEEVFGQPIEVAMNARLSDFLEIPDIKASMRLSGRMVDALILDTRGMPLLAIQMGDLPRRDDPSSEYVVPQALKAAGLPITYLGRRSRPEDVLMSVKMLRKTGAIR